MTLACPAQIHAQDMRRKEASGSVDIVPGVLPRDQLIREFGGGLAMLTTGGTMIGPVAKYHPRNCALIDSLVSQVPHSETWAVGFLQIHRMPDGRGR